MKKTTTLLLLILAISSQIFAQEINFQKLNETIRKVNQIEPTQTNTANRATVSGKIADVYYKGTVRKDSTSYYYYNNYAPYDKNDLVYQLFLSAKNENKPDSSATYDSTGVSATNRYYYDNQKLSSLVFRNANKIVRYELGYNAQGNFNQFTFDTLNTGGTWIPQQKFLLTYTLAGKVDSSFQYEYIGGSWNETGRNKNLYNITNLLIEENSYILSGNQWQPNYQNQYSYNGSGKVILTNYYEWNGIKLALTINQYTTYPQANTVLDSILYLDADTVNYGNKNKTINNNAGNPVYKIFEAYYDANSKLWMPTLYYDTNTQQSTPRPDTINRYTYNNYDQEIYNYIGTYPNGYTRNYYELFNTVSILEVSKGTLAVNMYPNPSAQFLNLEINSNQTEDIEIKIYNNIGQSMQSYHIATLPQLQLNISDLPPGIYHLSLVQGDKTQHHKFIKSNQ